MLGQRQIKKRKPHRKYTLAFKCKAIAMALKMGTTWSAAKKLKISSTLLDIWIAKQAQGTLTATPKRQKPNKTRTGGRKHYSNLYKLTLVEQVLQMSDSMAGIARKSKIPLQTLANWCAAYKAGKLGIGIKCTVEEFEYLALLLQRQSSICVNADSKRNTISAEIKLIKGLQAKIDQQR